MSTIPICVSLALAAALGSLVACSGTPLSGPPPLRLGRDECKECGMLINEDRCSAGMLAEQSGRREHLLFDDIGCMLDAEREGLDEYTIVDRYVHDHGTREWVSAATATFLFVESGELSTPMGSGTVAFAQRKDAEAASQRYGGELLDYSALTERRKSWMQDRYGRPAGQARPPT